MRDELPRDEELPFDELSSSDQASAVPGEGVLEAVAGDAGPSDHDASASADAPLSPTTPTALIEVAFKGNRKEFFLWPLEQPLSVGAALIVEADRGEDLGQVHAVGALALKRAAGVPHGPREEEPVTRFGRRLATAEEARRASELREQDDQARRKAMERVKANNLVMKISDAEWRWDHKKLTIYFTAEKRVDFRNLVRELASLFRTRIELKQIGVRDEAKRLDGIGRCGRQYCSASWLPELRPVNLGVAKDQRLSLNPSQISGACGRLMCCLRYEHEFYVQSRKRFPKEGKVLVTSKGEEKVIANDIFRDRVTLRGVDGETRLLGLADLTRELSGELPDEAAGAEDTSPIPMEALSDELLRMQDTAERPAFRPGWRPPNVSPAAPAPLPSGGHMTRALPVVSGHPMPPPAPPASPVAAVPSDRADAANTPAGAAGDAERPDETDARSTRRRGRRGGRRGRGGPERRSSEGGESDGDGGRA